MIVDTHCHLHDPAFADVRATVARSAISAVWGIVGVGCDPDTNERTLAAAEKAPGPLAPSLADDIAELVPALESPLPLGIGELVLQHPESTFPRIWQVIIGKLRDRGITVTEAVPADRQPRLTLLTAET
jgi:hypothetical protein